MFFTALAPNATPGSRDPLGLLSVWSRLGRRCVHNVTTVSADMRGWTTLVLCVGLFEDGVERGWWPDHDTDFGREPLYRAEQLIGYSRELNGGGQAVRGIGRIRSHIHDANGGPIKLGGRLEPLILGNQGAAGVWGQVAAAADASGLVNNRTFRLRPAGRRLFRVYREKLDPHHVALRRLLLGLTGLDLVKHEKIVEALAELCGPAPIEIEQDALKTQVLHAGRGGECPDCGGKSCDQVALAGLLRRLPANTTIDRLTIGQLAVTAEVDGMSSLHEKLSTIASAEALFGPAERLFGWLLTQAGRDMSDAAAEIKEAWGGGLSSVADCDLELQAMTSIVSPEARSDFGDLRQRLMEGKWDAAIEALLKINLRVMSGRGKLRGPWVQLRDGKFVVHLPGNGSLASPERHARELVHSYYIPELLQLVRFCHPEVARG